MRGNVLHLFSLLNLTFCYAGTRLSLMNVLFHKFSVILLNAAIVFDILGDPGTVSGGGEKSKRARKKFGRRNVGVQTRSAEH